MLSVAEALTAVLAEVPAPRLEQVTLADALGRVLGEPAFSDVDSPPHDKSLVDGYAVLASDLIAGVREFDVIEVRRTWLHGADTGRWAMVLAFAAYGQTFDESLVVGDVVHADVYPYPGALGLRVLMGRLHGEATTGEVLTVRIGHEGPYQELASTSVVATGYGPGDEAFARLGVVGPTRMDYPGSMAAVRAVARYVSRILDEA